MVKDLIIEKNYLENIKKCQVLGKGMFAHVYRLNEEEAIKIYYDKTYPILKVEPLLNVKNYPSNFTLPKQLVYLKEVYTEKVIGYIMNYAKGIHLRDYDKINFDDYLKAIINLKHSLEEFSLTLIQMNDVHEGNILFNANGENSEFNFIDADRWEVDNKASEKSILRTNTIKIVATIGEKFLEEDYIKLNKALLKMYEYYAIDSFDWLCELLNSLKENLENQYEFKIENMGDMVNILRG